MSGVEEIVLSDSDEEEPHTAYPANVIFLPGTQTNLEDESDVNITEELPGEVYPKNSVIIGSPEKPFAEKFDLSNLGTSTLDQKPLNEVASNNVNEHVLTEPESIPVGAAEGDSTAGNDVPGVLNPFFCDFEEINSYFVAPENQNNLCHRDRPKRGGLETKQQRYARLAKDAAIAKDQLEGLQVRPRRVIGAPKHQFTTKDFIEHLVAGSKDLGGVNALKRKEAQLKECSVRLNLLTLKTLVNNNTSRSSIDLFLNQKKVKEKVAFELNNTASKMGNKPFNLYNQSYVNVTDPSLKGNQFKIHSNKPCSAKQVNALSKEGSLGESVKTQIETKLLGIISSLPSSNVFSTNKDKISEVVGVKSESGNQISSSDLETKTKDLKILIKDLKTEKIVRIGNLTKPVNEILSQLGVNKASVKNNSSNASSSNVETPVVSSPYFQNSHASQSSTSSSESKSSSCDSVPKLRIRQDLFAPETCLSDTQSSLFLSANCVSDEADADADASVKASLKILDSDLSSSATKISPKPFSVSLKDKLSHHLSSVLTNIEKPATSSSNVQDKKFNNNTNNGKPTLPTNIIGSLSDDTSSEKINALTDKLLSFLPRRRVMPIPSHLDQDAIEKIVKAQLMELKGDIRPRKVLTSAKPISRSIRLLEKQSAPENQSAASKNAQSLSASCDSQQKYCESSSSESSSESSDDEWRGWSSTRRSSLTENNGKESLKGSNLIIKECSVVLEDCKKLLNKNFEFKRSSCSLPEVEEKAGHTFCHSDSVVGKKSRSRSPEINTVSRSKLPKVQEVNESRSKTPTVEEISESKLSGTPEMNRGRSPEVQEISESKLSQTPEINREISPEVQEISESKLSETPEINRERPPEVQEKNELKLSETSKINRERLPEVQEKSESKLSETPEINRERPPEVQEKNELKLSETSKINREISPEVQEINGPKAHKKTKEEEFEEQRSSEFQKDSQARLPEVLEANRPQSPINQETLRDFRVHSPKTSELQEDSRSRSPEVQKINKVRSPSIHEMNGPTPREVQEINKPRSSKFRSKSRPRSPEVHETTRSKLSEVIQEKRLRSPEDENRCPRKKLKPADPSPEVLTAAIFDVNDEKFPGFSIIEDILSVDGTFDFESNDDDMTSSNSVIGSSFEKKTKMSSYDTLAQKIFTLNDGSSESPAVFEELLSVDGTCDLKAVESSVCRSMVLDASRRTKCSSNNSRSTFAHLKMRLFDIESIPIKGKMLNEFHLDGNLDSEMSDDELLIKKKDRLKAKNVLATSRTRKISKTSLKKQRKKSSRNLPGSSVGTGHSVILSNFTTENSKVCLSSKKISDSVGVDSCLTVPEINSSPSPNNFDVSDKADEKLTGRKPVIKVIRLNYDKVKDGISVFDLDQALSATSRSTSINRRKQGKPQKYGFNINSRNGGVKSPSKIVSDLHFMVRNPRKRSK